MRSPRNLRVLEGLKFAVGGSSEGRLGDEQLNFQKLNWSHSFLPCFFHPFFSAPLPPAPPTPSFLKVLFVADLGSESLI